MNQRKTKVTSVLSEDDLLLYSLRGHEALSKPFCFELGLLNELEKPPIDSVALLGTAMTVHVEPALPNDSSAAAKPMRYFHGYVTKVAQNGVRGRYRLYHVELRPWLWLLNMASDCRVFQQKSVPQILEAVFSASGFNDFEKRLGAYDAREYCVQYRETDFAFVSRLLEHEGIYYYFRHDIGKHTLVLADGSAPHEPLPQYDTIDFALDHAGGDTLGERIELWRPVQRVVTGRYALKDYDFKKPTLALKTQLSAEKPHARSQFEKFEYPGDYEDVPAGERYVAIRLEEAQAHYDSVEGEGNTHGLAPGSTFTLAKSPNAQQNNEHLVIRADYDFALEPYESTTDLVGRPFRCTFAAIKSSVRFRPARVTPRPMLAGLQTARVVGRGGDEICTDAFGRVKVQFAWDREGKFDDQSSCWIRVAQVWAGSSWGTQYVPRVGAEVLVSFLEGDPDKPMITGSVYNGTNSAPFGLPGQAAVSGVKTDSTKDAVGYNEFSMDDTKGSERLNIHAQHDMQTTVEHDYQVEAKHKFELKVGDASVSVTNDALELKLGATSITLKQGQLELQVGPQSKLVLTDTSMTLDSGKLSVEGQLLKLQGMMSSIN